MGPKGRVLVVDDEPAIRALIAKIVERAGFPVDSARDGAHALEKLDQNPYAVLVVDLMMPNLDGYGLIQCLKERGGKHPAIIVISAADSASLRGLDGSMVHSIIRKPFDIDVLGDLISAAAESMAAEASDAQRQADIIPFRRGDAC
jgi:DNA-binding response OmpR family regulator